jgi:hypothetical protein
VFADGLSEASVAAFRVAVDAQWRRLSSEMVPLLEGLLAEDRRAERPRPARVRIGLYSFAEGGSGPAADPAVPRGASPRRRLPRPAGARRPGPPTQPEPGGPTR